MDTIRLKKAMKAYAKAKKLTIPERFDPKVEGWGAGAKQLAWRVSGQMKAHGKKVRQSTQMTDGLIAVLFPNAPSKFKIIPKTYKWNGALAKRIGQPGGCVWHNAAATNCTADAIHAWHIANTWRGIAYHFFVDKEGRVYQGRPEWAFGGHTLNYGAWLGVCCEGNYERSSEHMPKAQVDACIALRKYMDKKYGRLKHKGHRDMPGNSTACPGRNFELKKIAG